MQGLRFVVGRKSSAARAALRGTSPLPHLLQRGHACGRGVVSLGVWLETGDAAAMPTQKSSQPTKAGNHGLTGSARCNKCGSGLVPRSAARAALDLTGAESATANATANTREAPRGRRSPRPDGSDPYGVPMWIITDPACQPRPQWVANYIFRHPANVFLPPNGMVLIARLPHSFAPHSSAIQRMTAARLKSPHQTA